MLGSYSQRPTYGPILCLDLNLVAVSKLTQRTLPSVSAALYFLPCTQT